ncbi:MAG TPA: VRR-NUC domain-containing protein [Moraxellaceae bacterium]|nr:VRR-NUC domain-containing protein [Moraxellaceae bacterium]
MATVLTDPFYYLENFRHVLDRVMSAHADLLTADERARLNMIRRLPGPAQALLVRLVMRKGNVFRQSKLRYPEIGDIPPALDELARAGLVDPAPTLSLTELAALLRKEELLVCCLARFDTRLSPQGRRALERLRKDELLAVLEDLAEGALLLHHWHPGLDDTAIRLQHPALYDLLRLLFFGNLHQDWSEFVLTDLGHLRYEQVDLSAAARAFPHREDVEAYLHLWSCRERLEAGEATDLIARDMPTTPFANPWLERRRARLLFQMGRERERAQDWAGAERYYTASSWPEARLRLIRVLEQDGQPQQAYAMAEALLARHPREEDRQQLMRTLPRLCRKLGRPRPEDMPLSTPPRVDLVLPPDDGRPVEWIVMEHLHTPEAPVFYVENALINSLFGLLCWEAIFAPVPGAFFHDFHAGPADLYDEEFAGRREAEFARCLGLLDSGAHGETIRANWRRKQGIQSPFVYWETLDEALLELALACIPATHLNVLFRRLLSDIKNNRSGFPDLVQFDPVARDYRMIEVKGPGDRLQDNQLRWMDHFVRNGIPVSVAYVAWSSPAASVFAITPPSLPGDEPDAP